MKIGEFAKMTGMPISVLRHYDKEGLLCPDYVDHFSGYRYYSADQMGQVHKIELLKSGGLSLKEIRDILKNADDNEFIKGKIQRRNFQRISGFMTYGGQDKNEIQVVAEVVKLRDEMMGLHENINLVFEDDEQVIGKWKVVSEYAVKEDFYSEQGERRESDMGNKDREIYFLPGGEDYWIYSWTKGYLKLDGSDQSCLCRYQIEDYKSSCYMFVENKSYEYLRGGMPTVLVLEQVDNKKYTRREIAREDDTNIPFVNDERVLGAWKAFDFIRNKEEFDPVVNHLPQERLFFKHMHFGEEGFLTSVYMDETTLGKEIQSWTKGYVLRHYNHTACAYEIVTVDDTDYMIMEWKSGDYRWGGYDTDYYVLIRDNV